MIQKPIDVLERFPVRKSKKQKKVFREAVCAYAEGLGYTVKVEKGGVGSRNVVIGNPESAEHLITAHYDTCAKMLLPNLITPCNFWTFLLYQILIAALIFVPAAALGVLGGVLTGNDTVAKCVYTFVLVMLLVLMLFGPANRSNANDNTSGVVTVLKLAATIPQEQRDKVCFVLFDLEEAGLLGSSAYRNSHKKEIKDQLVWNLDCVGDGDKIVFFPSRKLKKDETKMAFLRRCAGPYDDKEIRILEKGFSVYPSDQGNFPYGVGIAALREGRLGLYIGKIHTSRDTVLDENNVNILCSAILSAITATAGQ